ncbi:hypothetical protein B6178_13100 [Staphylococcus aureus]|nr:hypothetical protein B6178_13100 [Staphylococcus aureus]
MSIQAKEYERTENRQSQRNGYYERSFTTRVGTLELKVPRTRDGHFSPTVFERYQRNEKALMASMLEMYVSGVSTDSCSGTPKLFSFILIISRVLSAF